MFIVYIMCLKILLLLLLLLLLLFYWMIYWNKNVGVAVVTFSCEFSFKFLCTVFDFVRQECLFLFKFIFRKIYFNKYICF